MSNKYLVILVTALNPSNMQVTAFGEKRMKQYVAGFERILELSQAHPEFDYVVVDNSIPADWQMPEALQQVLDKIPNLRKVFFNDNYWGAKNKGCGVLVDLQNMIKALDMNQYEYCLYFEPRQFLLNFDFFEKFLKNPGNYFRVMRFRVTAKTHSKWVQFLLKLVPFYRRQFSVGLYSLKTSQLVEYVNRADLERMADKHISLEDDMYERIGGYTKVKELGILWHDAARNKYMPF